jgi:hypothetical protein
MSAHDYSPQDALAILMRKLMERDRDLAAQVQAVVDEGKDVEETDIVGSRRKRTRLYRKTVPYSYDEALRAALKALEAYFIEQPLFASSCLDDFEKTALGAPKHLHQHSDSGIDIRTQGVEKAVQIELRTETQITEPGPETLPLKRVSAQQISGQKENLSHLMRLIDFREL